MKTMASQITSLTVVYSTVYSDADHRKHQSSASLAFVWGIHRDRWIPRTKGQLRGKCFHLMTSSWLQSYFYSMWADRPAPHHTTTKRDLTGSIKAEPQQSDFAIRHERSATLIHSKKEAVVFFRESPIALQLRVCRVWWGHVFRLVGHALDWPAWYCTSRLRRLNVTVIKGNSWNLCMQDENEACWVKL